MTLDERIAAIGLALKLGPVAPFVGRVPAKGKNWKREKNLIPDIETVKDVLAISPDFNFALITGKNVIAIDLDVRSDKNGIEYMKSLGVEIPKTPTVISGGGGVHYYFKTPDRLNDLSSGKLEKYGVELKLNTSLHVPGSIHQSGNPYRWAFNLSPADVPLADFPRALRDLFQNAPRTHTNDDYGPVGARPTLDPATIPIRISNWKKAMRTGSKLQTEGQRRHIIDFYNMCSLAWWCEHDWNLYTQIWSQENVQLKVYGKKQLDGMLKKAFESSKKNQCYPTIHAPRTRKKPVKKERLDLLRLPNHLTAILNEASKPNEERSPWELSNAGRPLSQNTKLVLDELRRHPSATNKEISLKTRVNLTLVRKIRSRQKV